MRGALRIPLIVALPGQGSAESGALAELLDLAPTFLELAGVQVPPEMDGVSLLPHLLGRQDVLKPFQLSELSNCQMLFDGRYKWIRNWNDRDELYDLLEDPDELDNRMIGCRRWSLGCKNIPSANKKTKKDSPLRAVLSLSKKSFLSIFWVLLHAGLASQALRKLFAGRTAWPAFRAKHETTIF